MTFLGFQTEGIEGNELSPYDVLLCAVLLTLDMMCELRVVLWECGGIFCSISATYHCAVLLSQG